MELFQHYKMHLSLHWMSHELGQSQFMALTQYLCEVVSFKSLHS